MNVKRGQPTIADRAVEYLDAIGVQASTGAIANAVGKSMETTRTALQRYMEKDPRLSYQDGYWYLAPLSVDMPDVSVNRGGITYPVEWQEIVTACRDEIVETVTRLEAMSERLFMLAQTVTELEADANKFRDIKSMFGEVQ